jgi:hypothetical protein
VPNWTTYRGGGRDRQHLAARHLARHHAATLGTPSARVFPVGEVGQLIAEGGAGKTMALCQLAVAVATGTRWLGTFEATRGRALLVLREEDAEEARRRLLHGGLSTGPKTCKKFFAAVSKRESVEL